MRLKLKLSMSTVCSFLPDDKSSAKRHYLASMSHLLSPLVSGNPNHGSRIALEREVQQLRELLEESEDKVAALKAQEKVMSRNIGKIS